MQIERLEIENFLSYESAQIDLADRGLILIEGENRDQGGSNGAGKTTLFEAICWALFGRVNSGLRGDDIRRLGTKNTRVRLALDVDGRRVEVTRHRAHKDHANAMHLLVDGEDSRGANDRETQARLSRLLALDWNSFVSVVLFPQGKQGIAAWTDAEQKTVLDTVLSLARFNTAQERVSKILQRDVDRRKTLEIKLDTLTEQVDRGRDQLEMLEQKEAGFEKEKETEIKSIVRDLEHHRAEEPEPIEPLQRKLENLQKQLVQSRQDDVLNMIDQLEFRLSETDKELATHIAKRNALRDIGLHAVCDPRAVVAEQDACPSCGQTLPAEALDRLLHTYMDLAERQRDENESRREVLEQLENTIAVVSENQQQAQQLLVETREKLVDTSDLDRQIQDLDLGIRERQHDITVWLSRKRTLDSSLAGARSKVSPYGDLVRQAKTDLLIMENSLEGVQKELEPLKDDIAYEEFWKKGFSKKGVKSLLLSTVTPFLNERANVYMDQLSRSTASIRIRSQTKKKGGGYREALDFAVNYNNAGSLYAAKSGGEQRRADLSILFALGDLAATRARAPIELRLLDEPFENLDSLGCEQVVELLLEHVVPRAKTVLVMSHNEDLKALFEQRITVVKERGVSRIKA